MIARSESHGVLTVEDSPPPAYETSNGSAAPGSGLGAGDLKDSLTRMSAGKLFSALLAALTPEIFQRKRGASAHRALRPGTAWLDGLRGWAAFIVCFVHLTVYTHPDLELCYGHPIPFKQDVFNYSPAAWPFLRVLWSGGHFSVAIFFVISGYVLTQKLTATLHENRRDDFIQSVNSAIFRRAIRLYMPVILSTFQLIFVWHVLGIQTPWPPRQPNLFREIIHWFNETMMFGFFFKTGFLFTIYNIHTWTIPVELRGSLFVWLWLFAFHQVENRIRIISTAIFLFYQVFFTPGAWYACFFAGMMTAELHNLWGKGSPPFKLPWDGIIRAIRARPFFLAVLMHLMFVASLYLAGEPGADMYAEELLYNCPGWGTLGRLIPVAYYDREHASVQRWFWLFWAAWFLVISGREIRWVKRFFETDFSQYLGKHSFSIYLCHGPMIGLLSERLFYLTGVKTPENEEQAARFGYLQNKWKDSSLWPFPDGGPPGLEPNFLFCSVLSVIAFLYVAELGTKMWDVPSTKFSAWAWKKIRTLS